MRIDAHQHFWMFDPVRDSWITEEMRVLQTDFLPRHLQPLLQQNGFDGCVLVQTEQTDECNLFLLQQAEEHGFIKGVVGWVDLKSQNIEDRLSFYQHFPLLKGFRHILQGEQDRAFMLDPSFMRGISALHKHQFTYDILVYPDQLPFVNKFVAQFPEQRFVLDHLAKPYIRDKKVDEWKKEIGELAQYPNLSCKVSGMVTEAAWTAWKKDDFTPYLDTVVEAFGVERLLYGSDWPVCLLAASYAQQLSIVQDYFSSYSKSEQEAIFGGNAVAFYQLK